jgi:hypothetical protein
VRRKVLLEVKVGDDNVRRRLEELLELVVKNELTTVLGVLETLVGDVLVDKLGHLRARDQLTFGKTEKLAQLRCNFLLAVEAVVGGTRLGLLTVGILLGVLHLTDDLGESLDIGAESGNFGLNGFKRHYTFLSPLIFK